MPVSRDDVERPTSVFCLLDGWLSETMRMPVTRIFQAAIDRPLEELLAQLEAQVGRSLTVG